MRHGWLAVLLCVFAITSAAAEPKGRALIVGINDYSDPDITDLRYSVADAKLLAGLLGDPARGVFPADQVRLLTDESPDGSKPDRQTILQGLEWLGQAGPDETILFYFSGHGMLDDKGRQYLVSRDVRPSSLAATGVPVSLVNEMLDDAAKTKARQIVVIFDSCHSGARRGARDGAGGESGRVAEGLLSDAEGRMTLSSCSADEQSFEDPDKGHGIFTYFLAQGLQGLADTNGDGLVSVGEAHVYVRDQVCAYARAKGNRQTPRVQANVSGEIILSRDPEKWQAARKAQSERRLELTQLRDRVLAAVSESAGGLPVEEGSAVLRALDRAIAGQPAATDARIVELAGRFGRGELKPAALRAELRAAGAIEPTPVTSTGAPPPPSPVKLQLFQPEWQSGAGRDELLIECAPGEEVHIVGMADSPQGITRVMLDDQVLSSKSLAPQALDVVQMAMQARSVVVRPKDSLRFEGVLRAGTTASTAVLKAVDAAGQVRLLQLRLQPKPGAYAGAKETVAVVGLSRKEVDQYPELRQMRIGMGLDKQLTQMARDVGRFRLVEEKAEILTGLMDRQRIQNSPAFDQATAVQVGKLLGARYVLYGEVYDFASPKENRGDLFMAVQVRLVDVATAALRPGSGEAKMKVPPGEKGDAEFDRSTLGQVSRQAIEAALKDLLGGGA